MPGRAYTGTGYRFGYNGKENDEELEDWQDYGMRLYMRRLVRFPTPDPIGKKYPELTPYQFASNRSIQGKDLDGLEFQDSKTGNLVKTFTDGNLDANDIEYITAKGKTLMEKNLGYSADDLSFTKGKGNYIVITDTKTGREIGKSATDIRQFKNTKEGTPISNEDVRYYVVSKHEAVFNEYVVSSESRTNSEIIALTRQFNPVNRGDANGVPGAYLPESKANPIITEQNKRGARDFREVKDMDEFGKHYKDSVPEFYDASPVDDVLDNADPNNPSGNSTGPNPE